jgi:primosomal protein N' (replication factor Y)
MMGVVVRTTEAASAEDGARKLKPVLDFPDPAPVVDSAMLSLTRWVAEYYLSSWGEALRAAIPQGLGQTSRWVVRPICSTPLAVAATLNARSPRQAEILRVVAEKGEMPLQLLRQIFEGSNLLSVLRELVRNELIEVIDEAEVSVTRIRTEKTVELSPAYLDETLVSHGRFVASSWLRSTKPLVNQTMASA